MRVAIRILATLGFVAFSVGGLLFPVSLIVAASRWTVDYTPLFQLQLVFAPIGVGYLLTLVACVLAYRAAGAAKDASWGDRLHAALLMAVVAPFLGLLTFLSFILGGVVILDGVEFLFFLLWFITAGILIAWAVITITASFRIGAHAARPEGAPADGSNADWAWSWIVHVLAVIGLLILAAGVCWLWDLVLACGGGHCTAVVASTSTRYIILGFLPGLASAVLAWLFCLNGLVRWEQSGRFWLVLAALPVAALGAAALLYALTGTVLPPDTETAFGDWLTVWLGAALVLLLWPAAILVFAESRARPRTLRPAT